VRTRPSVLHPSQGDSLNVAKAGGVGFRRLGGVAVSNPFFDHPIINSPYACPRQHWGLDESGQPTQQVIDTRRSAKFITPIPKPKKRKAAAQTAFVFDEGQGLSTTSQAYVPIRHRPQGAEFAWWMTMQTFVRPPLPT
jgi:hypothetical protein